MNFNFLNKMKKYNTFIIFLVLITLWSFLFWIFQSFTWTFFKYDFNLKLEQITWAMSLWWFFAYLILWIFSAIFTKRSVLFTIGFLVFIFTIALYYLQYNSVIWIIILISFIWVLYGFWSINKNSIIFIEINKTWKTDTFVNWTVGIIFIISLLIWSVIWPKIFEIYQKSGTFIVLIPAILIIFFSFFLRYSKSEDLIFIKDSNLKWIKLFINLFKKYLNNAIFIFKNYWMILICIWLLWAISTIIAQQAIEFSIEKFYKTESEAAFIFLYSWIWAIIWNIASIFIKNKRWLYFRIFVYIFAVLIFIFPIFAINYKIVIIFALIISILFWAASNLIDAYYFYEIWRIWKKEHWSWLYWLVISLIISILMFWVVLFTPIIWRNSIFLILWILIIICWILVKMNFTFFDIKKTIPIK